MPDRFFIVWWRVNLHQIFYKGDVFTLTEKFTLRLSAAELEHIRQQAEATNQTASAYLRGLIKRDMEDAEE